LDSSGDDRSMITFTGLDYDTFNYFAITFEEYYNRFTSYHGQRMGE